MISWNSEIVLFPVISYNLAWNVNSLTGAYSLFSKTIPIFTISSSSEMSSGVIFLKISLHIPISKAILNPKISKRASSPKIRGSTTRFIPPRIVGSVRIIPRRVRVSIIPIIFNRLKASRSTLRATPSAAANSNSLGIESPVRISFSFK